VTKIEKNMLKLFGLVETMDEILLGEDCGERFLTKFNKVLIERSVLETSNRV
jgi:hypothetical protein